MMSGAEADLTMMKRAAIAVVAALVGSAAVRMPAAAQSLAPGAGQLPVAPVAPLAPTPAPVGETVKGRLNDARLSDRGAKGGVDPAVLKAEVWLDRLHFSPGVIDGRTGANFEHALEAFESANGLDPKKGLDGPSWTLLEGKASPRPVLVDHVLTDGEIAGPFYPDLPKDYAKLATLPSIGYRSVAQKLGAAFHMGEDLLSALNPGVDLARSGGHILIVDTAGAPIGGKLARIVVDKGKSQVVGLDRAGRPLLVLPATIGSRELPSPSGTYKVKGVAWNPVYYYDPKNFVQGDNRGKLRLPSGPNNPVGSVFIALTKPTYGLHGTPDPSAIDKTASHGCVRMTNWDATELAHHVRPGLQVSFVQKR